MTKDELNNLYFEWMYRLISKERLSKKKSYRELLLYLHNVDFNYLISLDANREEDGIELRYRFGRKYQYDDPMISRYLDDRPCSVLEMMIALAIRCEEHIMDNPDVGDRTGQWFWNMIESLGLGSMTDEKFDEDYANRVIERFLNREYKRNGEGGLFTVKHCRRDLRTVEIWYQMCWYLDEIL